MHGSVLTGHVEVHHDAPSMPVRVGLTPAYAALQNVQ
jgi:hypothetical protein